MINNTTDSEQFKSDDQALEKVSEERPNESTGIYVRGFLKITDPETGQVIVQTGN